VVICSTPETSNRIPSFALLSSTRESHPRLAWRCTSRFVRNLWRWAHSEHVNLPKLVEIENSTAAIDASSNLREEKGDREAPIFLLASGWRTGSTLLQRILVTAPGVLVWGEPLGDIALVSRITEMLAHTPSFDRLNMRAIQGNPSSRELATSWIANLGPPGSDLRSALRALFDRWLGVPALERGFARWGFKEVRLGASEAMVLHWLYPEAKFLLLTRHPYDCYRSLADAGWDDLYYRRPDLTVDSAADFARHWNRLAVSWSELPIDFPCYRIRYENLVNGEVDFDELGKWLGTEIHADIALSCVVGHTSSRRRLPWYERRIISHEAAQGMRALGYTK